MSTRKKMQDAVVKSQTENRIVLEILYTPWIRKFVTIYFPGVIVVTSVFTLFTSAWYFNLILIGFLVPINLNFFTIKTVVVDKAMSGIGIARHLTKIDHFNIDLKIPFDIIKGFKHVVYYTTSNHFRHYHHSLMLIFKNGRKKMLLRTGDQSQILEIVGLFNDFLGI